MGVKKADLFKFKLATTYQCNKIGRQALHECFELMIHSVYITSKSAARLVTKDSKVQRLA